MQTSQKNFYKKLLGRIGENKATNHLKKLGYTILDRNFTTRVGEIDIIASDGEFIVFVEVKTRKDDSFGAPSEAVTKQKMVKYYKVATEYLIKNAIDNLPVRFDVIEVEKGKINHIIDAFCM